MGSVMKPYSDSVNKSMNDILGIADITLEKKSPEGTLGNFMVDAFYTIWLLMSHLSTMAVSG